MSEIATSPLAEQLLERIHELSEDDLHTVSEFIDYLIWKQAQTRPRKKSAEERAIERMGDSDDPTKWITVVEEGDEIDVDAVYQRLEERGFEIQIPSENSSVS